MTVTNKSLFASGHRACPGCGVPIAVRAILDVTGPNVVVVTATGCLETFTSPIDLSCWEVPWIHGLFENAPAIATGIAAALKAKGNPEGTKVVAICGDGSTYDIGFGSLSGMFERRDKVLYVCYDNEAYMNTGIQRSSSTPYGATTTTTPHGECSFGKLEPKKDIPGIAVAHNIPYVATSSIAYIADLKKKVKKGLEADGPAYLHVYTPCNIGWGFNPELTVEIARLGVETGLYPLYEYENGKLTSARKQKEFKPVVEYLKLQKRFKHLVDNSDKYREQLAFIQNIAKENIEKFGLLR
jgi:pyruvate ferredoxin oxidoreductase beta subunit